MCEAVCGYDLACVLVAVFSGVRPAPSGCHRMAVGGAAQPAAEEGSESTVCYPHSAGRFIILQAMYNFFLQEY